MQAQLLSLITITQHQVEDCLLFIPFLLGQFVYILKRAGFSMRAGRCSTRRAYIYQNWDIITFRLACELVLIYFPVRHFSVDQILSILHIDLSSISWLRFLANPVASPVSLFGIGIGSDGLFDWLVDWASRSPKIPQVIKNWLTENVPPMPMAK